jgi:hypothetical protein
MPFYMAGGFVKLQFASMIGNKEVFFMLALIILGKESCTCSNVDVYLQPLINELQLLWKGVG